LLKLKQKTGKPRIITNIVTRRFMSFDCFSAEELTLIGAELWWGWPPTTGHLGRDYGRGGDGGADSDAKLGSSVSVLNCRNVIIIELREER